MSWAILIRYLFGSDHPPCGGKHSLAKEQPRLPATLAVLPSAVAVHRELSTHKALRPASARTPEIRAGAHVQHVSAEPWLAGFAHQLVSLQVRTV